jgi:curved DNA-binding protein CbpA
MRNFYAVLRVAPKASDAEIKSAFRNLAKTCHPDMKPGDREAEDAFQEAKRAYRFLSNPVTRQIYDDFLAHQKAAGRRRWRRSVATMSVSFALTASVGLLATMWLQEGGVSLVGRLLAQAPEPTPERTVATGTPRVPATAEASARGKAAAGAVRGKPDGS